MDFRMRTLKQNKNNYNSLVHLQRPIDEPFARSINHSSSRKNLHEQQPANDSFDGFKLFNGQNSSVIQGINQRIGQLEQRVDMIYLETMGLSHKGDLGKEARNSLSFQNSSQLQQNSLFRQSVVANIAKQKQQMQTHGARCEEIETRQARLQQRLRDWMNSQKQEISYRLHTQTEEMKGAQLSKIKRYDYQYDNIKNIIHELQLKLETDIEYKFKALSAVKQDFSHSLGSLREEISREIGQNKEGFTSFVRQIKQSFQSLKEALNKDRQNVKQAIFELQSNGQSNASKAQKGLENATRSFTQKHDKLQKKISSFKDEWNSFKMITNQHLQEYKEIVVNVEANILENLQSKKGRGEGGNTDEIKEQFSEWRMLTEQKNLNIFREITNAIKVQRLQWRKEHDEMQVSIQQNIKSVKQIKSTLNKKIEKANTQLNIQLKESLEGMTHKLEQGKEITAIIKKQLEEKIINSNMKLSQNIDKQLTDLRKQLQSSIKDIQSREFSTKKSQQESIDEIKQQLTIIKVHTDTELQSLVKSIAQDNEQWQLELKANEKKLKDSFSKQIEESALGRQQLIEAKYKQIEDSLLTVRRYAEKGFSDERNETVKQIMKVTEELTSLVNDWSSKGKKERQVLQNSLKQQLLQTKKSTSKMSDQVKAIAEDIKKKNQLKQAEDDKKNSELKIWVQSTVSKTSKTGDQEAKTMNKKIDTLKIEIQGRLKASTDKLLLEINMKKQLEAKAKEQQKSKAFQQEKKLTDLYTKLKGEFTAQFSKTSKLIEDQSSKNNKKNEGLVGGLKKQMQGELQKQRKYCVQQLARLKGQLELKIKAKQQKAVAEQNSKKQAQVKQKEDQFKAKLSEADKKLVDGLAKLKTELIGEIGKSKTTQIDQISKVKKQIQSKIKSIEEQKEKKQAESRGKQQQLKDKEKELKDRSTELDSKLQSTKKDIQKTINEEISKAKTEINQKVQKSVIQARLASQKQLEPLNKSIQQQKLRIEQAQKKLQDLKLQTDKKIAQLKGVSLTSMKNQEEQAKKAHDKKIQTIKADLLKLIETSNNKLKQNIDSNTKLASANQIKFTELSSLLKSHEILINKVEAGLFADRQKNKAIHDKMTTDLLDIADSITLVLTQMKPSEK